MNNGHTNGFRNKPGHYIVASLDGVIQYDQKSESGSGKMGKLCICQLGISLIVSGSDDSDICNHETSETSFYSSLPNLKNCFLSVDGKIIDFAEMTDVGDIQIEKLILYCKDFREVVLNFNRGDEPLQKFLKTLWDKVYRKIESPSTDVCRRANSSNILSFLDKDSWERELVRLKVNSRKDRWKVVENKEFKSCGITAKFFVVPNSMSVENVTATGSNHANCRFMSWCWTDSETMVSLLRCSEPQTILNNSYLHQILRTGRAKTHAVLSTAHLRDSCPDESVISHSFEKLWNACLVKDDESFYKNLESSKWLHHIQALLRASRHIARTIKCDRNPVVVLDETGRDMSCLVVSLVLILCDRHCRTINGFANLINKEWISAGYSFCSSLMSIKGKDSHFSPTFIMFLDCVHNIILQYPTEFEFTDMYLTEILDKILAGESELFMFNCPKDISLVCKEKENEIVNDFWQKVLKERSKYVNPLFNLQDRMFKTPSENASFDEKTHVARTSSYSYAVSKGIQDISISHDKENTKKSRRGTLGFKSFKKPIHLIPKSWKKPKVKKDKPSKVGSSSFFRSDSESPRERLTSIKNIFKSKFDPINVNYSLINIHLWNRYYFRHIDSSEWTSGSINVLGAFVNDIKLSCSDFMSSHCSEDSYDVAEENSSSDIAATLEPELLEPIQRSDSLTTINSDRIHVSEIDLFNDHVDKDYESAEELSLNGLSLDESTEPLQSAPVPEDEKRLSHVMEEPEMSNTKSPQTVVLEIAEATNDIQDF